LNKTSIFSFFHHFLKNSRQQNSRYKNTQNESQNYQINIYLDSA